MKPSETEAIYAAACRAKRIIPQPEECRMWHKVLAIYEARDVRAALDAWWAGTDTDSKGELKSKWLPTPGELKPLIEKIITKRVNTQREPHDMIAWECAGVDRHRSTGFYPRSQPTPTGKKCHCGAELRAFVRDAA